MWNKAKVVEEIHMWKQERENRTAYQIANDTWRLHLKFLKGL